MITITQKTILFFFLVSSSLIISCGPSKEELEKKRIEDSTSNAIHLQDSLRRADSLANAAAIEDSAHTIAIMSLSLEDSSCQRIRDIIKQDTIEDPLIYNLYAMKNLQCKTKAYNAAHPERATVVVVHEEEGKILFNTIRVSTAKDVAAAAKKIITIGAFVKSGGDPIITSVATVAGNYSVDAYLEAAKNNDPLIIIFPAAIPGKQLAKDGLKLTENVYKEITKIDPAKPFEIAMDGAKATVVGAQAAANLAIEAHKKAGEVLIDGTGKAIEILGDGAKAAGKALPWNW